MNNQKKEKLLNYFLYNFFIKKKNFSNIKLSNYYTYALDLFLENNNYFFLEYFRSIRKESIKILENFYRNQDSYTYYNLNERRLEMSSFNIYKRNSKNLINLNNVNIYKGHLITNEGYTIIDKNSDPLSMPFISGMNNLIRDKNKILLYSKNEDFEHFNFHNSKPYGFIFGKNYLNFFHNIVEYLPKLENLIENKIYNILIPDDIPSSIDNFLRVFYPEINMIFYNANKINLFKNIFCIKGHYTFDDSLVEDLSHTKKIDFVGLKKISKRIKKFAHLNSKYINKKIYLRRLNRFRNPYGEKIMMFVLKLKGYEIVYPERLNIFDQISIFIYSSKILSVTGATLTLSFLSSKKTKIYSLQSYDNNKYDAITQLCKINGASNIKILGYSIKNYKNNIINNFHSRFFVNLLKIIKL